MCISGCDKILRREHFYTIGEISKLYHIGVDSLRYYEKKGILEPVRGENGYRYYDSRSIWRMNVITNLRNLGFSVERIKDYFLNRTVESTQSLLQEELTLVENKLKDLEALQRIVQEQLHIIAQAQDLELDKVKMFDMQPRKAYEIRKDFSQDEDMDFLMMRLLEQSHHNLFMIGNNRLGSIIADEPSEYIFKGAILFDDNGDMTFPGGTYLSICYRGATDSLHQAGILKAYAKEHSIILEPPFIELVWIDIHTASDISEFINEVQVKVAT